MLVTSNNMNTKFPVNQPIILENSVRNALIGQIVVQDYDTIDAVTMRTTNMQISIVNQQCVPTVKVKHEYSNGKSLVLMFISGYF